MIEQLRPGVSAKNARVVLFDFDGTISVIRSGWMDVMVPMMVEILSDLKSGETEEQLRGIVEEFGLRATRIRDVQGVLHFVPNGQITAINRFTLGYVTYFVDLRLPAELDVDAARAAVQDSPRSFQGAKP